MEMVFAFIIGSLFALWVSQRRRRRNGDEGKGGGVIRP